MGEALLSTRALTLGAAVAALLGLLPACATTTETVRSPARSVRGRVGFGVMSTTQRQLGGTLSGFRTAIAGASAPGVEPGGGDWVWRVNKTGTSLDLCHGPWASRPCRTALFDGGPNLMGPLVKFSTYPVLVDPINLGRVGVVSTDAQGHVWVSGNLVLDVKNQTMPVTPGYGVWALGGGAMLHHCQLEGETPSCRVAKLPDGKPVGGRPLSVKTYGSGSDVREGVWIPRAAASPCSSGSRRRAARSSTARRRAARPRPPSAARSSSRAVASGSRAWAR